MHTNTIAGLPTEVTLYHPIEFIQLDKLALGFLDKTLQKEKGGPTAQLLVGHVVTYIAQNGLENFANQPYFRTVYIENLEKKFLEKGIDLKNPSQYNVNFQKLQRLSDNTSIVESEDGFLQAANIYSSSNYDMFHLLPFNRTIGWKHVQGLVESIKVHGVTSYPLVIYTDCIDGEWKYWIVDGQHRMKSFQKLGLPIYFTLYQKQTPGPVTKRDIVKLVSQVNNTSRKWSVLNYLKAWVSLDIPQYLHLNKQYEKTKVALSVILICYCDLHMIAATKKFTNGVYQITDQEKGDEYVQFLFKLRDFIPKGRTLQSAFVMHCKEVENYRYDEMVSKLRLLDPAKYFGESIEEILVHIRRIYSEL